MNQHVTVLIPAYNTEAYIGQAIKSVLAQSYKDFDVLVVDDGSTDSTSSVVTDFIRTDHPVSLLQIPKNSGVTNATHLGILSAQGPVITIVDSDDTIFPHSLKLGVAPFKDSSVGFVWTKFQKSQGSVGWSRALPEGKSLWQAMMYHKWWNASHQRFFRKATYEQGIPLNVNIKRSSDYQFVLLLGLSGCKTMHIPAVTYWYRTRRQGSITSQGPHLQRAAVQEIKKWVLKEMGKRGIGEPS